MSAFLSDDRRPDVAVITGGGRGIGRLAAVALAAQGTAVGVVGRSDCDLADTVELIERAGGVATHAVADVTDPAGFVAAVNDVERRLGPVDLLVNNAGVSGPIGPLWEVETEAWWATMDVNLRGVLLGCQIVLPGMVAHRRGRIINLTSRAGVHRWPLVSAYSVSKAAVVKLTENLARETARHGIAVFSIHPGLLPLGMSIAMTEGRAVTVHERQVRQWTLNELNEGRGADPQQAIELIVRVANGDADSLSGQHLSVHDHLDDMVARQQQVHLEDLYVMRPSALADAG